MLIKCAKNIILADIADSNKIASEINGKSYKLDVGSQHAMQKSHKVSVSYFDLTRLGIRAR